MRKIALLAVFGVAVSAHAQIRINELGIDMPGGDNGQEFFELLGTPGASLDGLWFLSIEGDNSSQGVIDKAISLQGRSLGSNGLLLWRDSATALLPAPDAATTVVVGDFDTDLENGSNTFAIVRGYTCYIPGATENNVPAQTDIDGNNDGVIGDVQNVDGSNVSTILPWAEIVDSISWRDIPGTTDLDKSYGTAMGGYDFATTIGRGPGNIAFNADAFIRLQNGVLVAADIESGTNPGPYFLDSDEAEASGNVNFAWLGAQTLTPGSANPVPEPATIAALGLGLAAVLRRKRSA